MTQKEKVFFLKFLLIGILVCFLCLLSAFIIAYTVTSLSEPDILNDQSKQTLKQLDESDSKKAKKIFNKFNSLVGDQLIALLSTKENIKNFLDTIDENANDDFFNDLYSAIYFLFYKDNKNNELKINVENQKAFLLNLNENNIKFFSKLRWKIIDINKILETSQNIEEFLKSIDSKDKENLLINLLESWKSAEFIKNILNFGQFKKEVNKNFENLKVFLQKINSDNVDLMVYLINIDFFRKLNWDYLNRNILNQSSDNLLFEILDVINKDNSEFLFSYINDENILKQLFIRVNFPDLISFLKLINEKNRDIFIDFFKKDFLRFLYRLGQNTEKIAHHLEKMAKNIEKDKDAFQNAMNAFKTFYDKKDAKQRLEQDFEKLLIFVLTSDNIEKYKDLNEKTIEAIINSDEFKNYKLEPVYYPLPVTTSLFNPVYDGGGTPDISPVK